MKSLKDVTEKAHRFLSYFNYYLKKSDYSNNYYIVVNNYEKTFGKFLFKRDIRGKLYFKLDFSSIYGTVIAFVNQNTKYKKNNEIHFKIHNDRTQKYTKGIMTLFDDYDTYTSKRNPCFIMVEESKIINEKLYPYKRVIIKDEFISFYNLLKERTVIIYPKQSKLEYYINKDKKLQIVETSNNISISSNNIIVNADFKNGDSFYETCFNILPEIFEFLNDEITSYNEENINIIFDILCENIKDKKHFISVLNKARENSYEKIKQ